MSQLKVIGAGAGRTGTSSLKEALEILLEGKCYHMKELDQRHGHAEFFNRAARGEKVNWDDVLSTYVATADFPACLFYKELMEAYPDARVILSVRDPVKWEESCEATIWNFTPMWEHYDIGTSIVMRINPVMRRIRSVSMNAMRIRMFGDDTPMTRETSIAWFKRHNAQVIADVPREKLLVFEAKDGWEPLCKFLDLPVPDVPFPHVNERDNFKKFHTCIKWTGYSILGVGSLAAAYLAFRVASLLKR